MLKRELSRKETGIEYTDSTWKSDDDLNLHTHTWMPLGDIRGVIVIIHGLGEHGGRYADLAEKLGNTGFIVCSFDLRGHGRSEGRRGHTKRYADLLHDIEAFLDKCRTDFPDLPQYLYGHSLGGNLVLNYATRNHSAVQGIIVTSPWLKLRNPPSKSLLFIVDILGKILPGFLVKNRLKAEDLSRDLRVVHDYRTDKLVHNHISLRMLKQVYYAGINVSLNIYKINTPLLVMHGSADNITSCKATREFVRNSSNKTTYIEWQDGYHELHNDLHKEEVLETLLNWLNQQVI